MVKGYMVGVYGVWDGMHGTCLCYSLLCMILASAAGYRDSWFFQVETRLAQGLHGRILDVIPAFVVARNFRFLILIITSTTL
jgi:hypothetical protein